MPFQPRAGYSSDAFGSVGLVLAQVNVAQCCTLQMLMCSNSHAAVVPPGYYNCISYVLSELCQGVQRAM